MSNNTPSTIYSSNTRIYGTLISGKPDHTYIFCEHYRCSIWPSEKQSIVRQIGSTGMHESVKISEEKVYQIQITENMINELVEFNVDQIKQKQLRERDERLNELYNAYITLYHLLK